MDSSFLKDIQTLNFPKDQYIPELTPKRQLVLHHTASGKGVNGDFKYWLNTPSRIATCVIVDYNGIIHQAFNSGYWAYHLGVPGSTFKKLNIPYINLNKISIGIEIDSWGNIYEEKGKYYTWAGTEIEKERVIKYDEPFKVYAQSPFFESKNIIGEPCKYYERYTRKQLESVKNLLLYWGEKYCISLHYNEDMWDLNKNALLGEEGIWTHVSYRESGKSDCHPQEELINMIKSLT